MCTIACPESARIELAVSMRRNWRIRRMKDLQDLYETDPERFIKTLRALVRSDVYRDNVEAILLGAEYRVHDAEYVEGLKELLHSDLRSFGIPIANYATGVLGLLGELQYSGDDPCILGIIRGELSNPEGK